MVVTVKISELAQTGLEFDPTISEVLSIIIPEFDTKSVGKLNYETRYIEFSKITKFQCIHTEYSLYHLMSEAWIHFYKRKQMSIF